MGTSPSAGLQLRAAMKHLRHGRDARSLSGAQLRDRNQAVFLDCATRYIYRKVAADVLLITPVQSLEDQSLCREIWTQVSHRHAHVRTIAEATRHLDLAEGAAATQVGREISRWMNGERR